MSRFKPRPMVSRDKRREREYHSRWSGLSVAEWEAFGAARATGKSLSHPDVQAAIRAIEARDRADGIKPPSTWRGTIGGVPYDNHEFLKAFDALSRPSEES